MTTRRPDATRDLIEQLDARLREAEQVRTRERERWLRQPFYPDRRGADRVSDDAPEPGSDIR